MGASVPEPITRADLVKAMPVLGSMIRYAFYVIGAVTLGMFALFGVPVKPAPRPQVQKINEAPSFHLAAPFLARLSMRTEVLTHPAYGRAEVRQYGQLYDRDEDLTIAMYMPPKGTPMVREFGQQLRNIRPMNTARAVFGSTFFDIHTRFGPVRAADLRVESDGQWKQCLAFLSRLDTLSVFFTGWYCDASGAKPSADHLACTLDRLALDRELDAKEADTFLRERLARPASCSATPVSQTTDTRARTNMSAPQRWSTPSSTYRRY